MKKILLSGKQAIQLRASRGRSWIAELQKKRYRCSNCWTVVSGGEGYPEDRCLFCGHDQFHVPSIQAPGLLGLYCGALIFVRPPFSNADYLEVQGDEALEDAIERVIFEQQTRLLDTG